MVHYARPVPSIATQKDKIGETLRRRRCYKQSAANSNNVGQKMLRGISENWAKINTVNNTDALNVAPATEK
jgi:hypothetical protein